jgi:hypothetical protein
MRIYYVLHSDGKMKLTAILLVAAAAMPAQPAPDTIKLDNEFVRVSFLTDQPRTKTPLHRHEFNRVMIYLDPMELVLRYQDGEIDHQRWSKGQVAWSPGGRLHTGENLIDHTARVVEVELKKPPSGKPLVPTERDPLKVNPKNVNPTFALGGHFRLSGQKIPFPFNIGTPKIAKNRLGEDLASFLRDRSLACCC